MSFFQSIGGYQQYLQNALSSTSNQNALQQESSEAATSLQNEDDIANEELKSSGLSDLFLGSPVAIRAITEGRGIYQKAKATYGDIKKGYQSIKENAQAVKDFITTSPEKLAELRTASLGEDMTPEKITQKLTDLFGEKIASSPIGKALLDKVQVFKDAHESLKAAALEHLEQGNKLHAELTSKGEALGDLLSKPAEALSRGQLDMAGHLKNAIDYAQGSAKGLLEAGSELAMKKQSLVNAMKATGVGEGAEARVAKFTEENVNKRFERLKQMASKAEGTVSEAGETILKQAASVPAAEARRVVPKSGAQEFMNPAFDESAAEPLVTKAFKAKRFGEEPELTVTPSTEGRFTFGSPSDLAHELVGSVNYDTLSKLGAKRVPVMPEEAKSVLSTFDNFKSKASDFYGKFKQSLSDIGESTIGQVAKNIGGVALEGANVFGGIEAAQQLAQGKVTGMNVLGASQLKSAPEAIEKAGSLVQKGVSSISEKAGTTLSEYAAKAKASVSDTLDLMKSSLVKTGEGIAEKVGEGVAEKGLGSLALEAGLGTIPVVGEIADIGLGIGAVVSAVKDLFHKPTAAPVAPTITQGVQITRQAGVY